MAKTLPKKIEQNQGPTIQVNKETELPSTGLSTTMSAILGLFGTLMFGSGIGSKLFDNPDGAKGIFSKFGKNSIVDKAKAAQEAQNKASKNVIKPVTDQSVSLLANVSTAVEELKLSINQQTADIIGYLTNNVGSNLGDSEKNANVKLLIDSANNNATEFIKAINSVNIEVINDNFKEIPKALRSLAEALHDINDLLDSDSLKEEIQKILIDDEIADKLTKTTTVLTGLADIAHVDFEGLPDAYMNIIKVVDTIQTSGSANLGEVLSKMLCSDDKTKDISDTVNVLTQLGPLMTTLANLGKNEKAVLKGAEVLGKIGDKLNNALAGFANLPKNLISDLSEVIHELTILVVSAGFMMLFGALLMKIIDVEDLLLFAGALLTFNVALVGGILSVQKQFNIDEAKESLEEFSKLVFVSGVILLAGGLLMSIIDIGNLALFAGTLLGFIWAMTFPYKLFLHSAEETMEGVEEFSKLVFMSGVLLLAGGLLMQAIDIVSLLEFAGVLTGFIFAISIPYQLFLHGADQTMEGATEFSKLVLISGVLLLAGGLLMKVINTEDLLLFTGTLFGFIFGLSLIYKRFLHDSKQTMAGALEFSQLVLISGIVLLAGGLLMKTINILDMLEFTGILFVFVTGTSFIYKKFLHSSKQSMAGAAEFATLVKISATTLLLGGLLFTIYPKLIEGVTVFGTLLFGFILGVSFSYKLANKGIGRKEINTGKQLSLLVAISAGVLTVAALFMEKHPAAISTIPLFGLAFLLLINIMLPALRKLSNFKQTTITKAMIALGGLSTAILIASTAMIPLVEASQRIDGVGGFAKFLGTATVMFTVLGGMTALTLVMATTLGNGVTTVMAYAAIGVLLAAAGAIWVVSDAMCNVADALDKLSEAKSIDSKVLKNNVLGVVELASVLGKLAMYAPQIIAASIAFTAMSHMISKIGEAVEEYANLKVPVYGGTKIVAYKQLKQADFKNAAKNVKTIITVLGGAVINAYETNPEIFAEDLFGRSKFSKITRSLGKLGPMLSKIARAVKNYASLKIAVYGTGAKAKDIIGYEELTSEHFKSAAENVKTIISVLGGAIIAAYEEHPEYYDSGLITDSPFTKTVKANSNLAILISRIGASVEKFANFKVATDWVYDKELKGPRATKWRELDESDFQKAADNVKLIMTILGGAIVAAYEEHPDYYDSGLFTDSPFTKTIKANANLAKLISSIGKSVEKFANFQVATAWVYDKDLKGPRGTQYRELTTKDFTNAANNVKIILTTLGGAIIATYNDPNNKGMYDSDLITDSPFTKTIKANQKLAKLISSIGNAVKEMASGKIETAWDRKDGHAISYEQLSSKHFNQAAKNIQTILTTLGGAIIKTYEDNKSKGIFDGGGFLGLGDSPFTKVVKANKEMGDMIGGLAKTVKDLSNGKIETEWDSKTGKPIKFETLGPKHFEAAAEGIKKIISTLGKSIIDTYNDPKYKKWFDDGEDSDFAMATKAIGSMGEMIGNLATGLASYATMQYPIEWNKETGQPVAFQHIGPTEIGQVKENIEQIVGTLGESIMKTYTDHKEWFNVDKDDENSTFTKVCTSIATMGDVIGNISEGLVAYASLNIPTAWNKETGQPINFKPMTDTDFQNAATNIGKVITTIGGAIMGLYGNGNITMRINDKDVTIDTKEMFELPSKKTILEMIFGGKESDNRFVKIVNSVMTLGDLIGTIAESIQFFASMNVPTAWDPKTGKPTAFEPLTGDKLKSAYTNIGEIITTLGGALIAAYNGNKEMFTPIPVEHKTGIDLGLFSFGITETTLEDSPIIVMIRALQNMGYVITSIARGIQNFAFMKMPEGFNSDGTATGYKTVEWKDIKQRFTEMMTADDGVMLIMATTLDKIYKKNTDLFESETPIKISRALRNMGNAILLSAKGLQMYAAMTMPIFDEKGEQIVGRFKKMEEQDFKDAAGNVAKVLTTIADAVVTLTKDPKFDPQTGEYYGALKNVGNLYAKIGNVLPTLAKGIKDFANLEVGEYVKDSNGNWAIKPGTALTPTQIDNAKGKIKDILIAIGEGIVDAVKDNPQIFNPAILKGGIFSTDEASVEGSPAMIAATAIMKLADPVVKMANIIKEFSGHEYKDEKGNIISLTTTEIAKGVAWIREIINAVIDPIKEKWNNPKEYDWMFNTIKTETISKAFSSVSGTFTTITGAFVTLAQTIKDMDVNDVIKKMNVMINGDGTNLGIIDLMNKLKTPQSFESNSTQLMTNMLNTIYGASTGLQEFITDLTEILNLAQSVEQSDKESFTILGDGIAYLQSKINLINEESTKNITNQKEELKKYIAVINGLDSNKLLSLNVFTLSLNALASKLGNLDHLTEAIAKTLNAALEKLTKELKTAKETINKAESIQKDRHKKINESIEKVKTIMGQSLNINIQNITDTTPLSSDGTGGFTPVVPGSSGTSQQSSGSSGSSASQTGGPGNTVVNTIGTTDSLKEINSTLQEIKQKYNNHIDSLHNSIKNKANYKLSQLK